MSIKILGKKYLKTTLEKERDKLRQAYADIADEFDEYMKNHPEDAYTEHLQNKQMAISARLDDIGWS